MPSLTQLDVVHRLNAPTRAAATRRRRMRKALTCVLVVLAALIAFGGRGSATASSSDAAGSSSPLGGSSAKDGKAGMAGGAASGAAPASALAGRRLVSVPVDATLRDALDARSRVDVWSSSGARLVRDAPVVLSSAQPARVLVGVRPQELTAWARAAGSSGATGDDMLVTLAP